VAVLVANKLIGNEMKKTEVRQCCWCCKKFETKLVNGYQPLNICCCEEHHRLYERKRIADIGEDDDETRIYG